MKDPGRRKRRRWGEVLAPLRQADEALVEGKSIAQVVRLPEVSTATLRRRRSDDGALVHGAVKPRMSLEIESARLKRLVGDQQPDNLDSDGDRQGEF